MSNGGKGSGRRPLSVPSEEFDDKWEQIFGKKKQQYDPNVEKALDEMVRINEELGLYEDYK